MYWPSRGVEGIGYWLDGCGAMSEVGRGWPMLMGGKSVSSVTIASGEREIRDQQRGGPAICLRARAGLVSVPETARIRLAAFDQATARRHPHTMLWVRACQTAMLRTLSRPRTTNCRSPRLRAWALEHSAVAARSL